VTAAAVDLERDDALDVAAAHARAADAERDVFAEVFRARERMSLREWSNARRWLSPEANALAAEAHAPVRYSMDLTPYHREIYDAISDPLTKIVACKLPSQDGKTEIVNNFVGRAIDIDPGPMLVLQPTSELGEAWSKDRLAPMIRDCPVLQKKVRDARSRDADNTILHKKFPGGHLTIVGSNSPAGLSARPIRDVLVDEVDRCAKSAGTEGDPIRLAFRRATTFRRGKKLLISSPTVLNDSRIDAEYMLGTQEELELPCPDCGEYQPFVWGAKLTYGLKWENDDPKTAHYVCRSCTAKIPEHKKAAMIDAYRWVARAPENGPERRSFTKNALASKLVSWVDLVREWKEIQGKITELQTFINTVLCELWDPLQGKSVKLDALLSRRGLGYPEYGDAPRAPSIIPDEVAYIFRSVDTQDDRLETAVWGFGHAEESWLIDWQRLEGDPALPPDNPKSPFALLDLERAKQYRTLAGATLTPLATFIDSGGHHTKQVYDYTRTRQFAAVFSIKGSSQQGAPLLGTPNRNNHHKVLLVPVGSFAGKETLTKRLARITEPGPGFIHLPPWLDVEQVTQFTRLRLVTPTNKGGGRKWVKPKPAWEETGAVEQSILYVYALAALQTVGAEDLKNLGVIAKAQAEDARAAKIAAGEQPEKPDGDDDPNPPTPINRKRRGGGWATGGGQWG
jgi:phage terminase large subunit GpA-like protein